MCRAGVTGRVNVNFLFVIRECYRMKPVTVIATAILLLGGAATFILFSSCGTPDPRWSDESAAILVFSKTEGYRHKSIADGRDALRRLGSDAGYRVVLSEDAGVFNEAQLAEFAAVVFLNTTGDILDATQQEAFERYIQGGGGFVGIHAAADTEYDWDWYGQLVGARFDSHPKTQEGLLRVVDAGHPATWELPSLWRRVDEWYNFRNIVPDSSVLIEIDESSYSGGTNGEHHPIAWYRVYDGGRVFYTAMGHTRGSYEAPGFLSHLAGGLAWAMGDESALHAMPEQSRFKREILDQNLDEPMELDEIPGEGIIFIERRGSVKFHDFALGQTRVLGKLDVFYGHEDGLLGLAVDPDFDDNH